MEPIDLLLRFLDFERAQYIKLALRKSASMLSVEPRPDVSATMVFLRETIYVVDELEKCRRILVAYTEHKNKLK